LSKTFVDWLLSEHLEASIQESLASHFSLLSARPVIVLPHEIAQAEHVRRSPASDGGKCTKRVVGAKKPGSIA
jgi:hypothetical protein